jgi:hypothetical protein
VDKNVENLFKKIGRPWEMGDLPYQGRLKPHAQRPVRALKWCALEFLHWG